jgi:radical SAM superfamily enzyme YgiQ (UPF0313 family)
MAKVLLIQPNRDRELKEITDDIPVPLNLVYIGTAIEDKHSVKIYDRNLIPDDDKLLDFIGQYNPNIIGITSMTSKMLLDLYYIIKLIKEKFPKTLIVVGGIHATIEPDSLLQEPEIDYIIRGEGEEAFLEFCNTYDKNPKNLKKLKNVNKNPLRPFVRMDDLKLPDYSLVDVTKYTRFQINLSRGCASNCTFCYSCKMWGKDKNPFIRTYSTEKSKEYFKEIIEKYGIKTFEIADDNFVQLKSRAVELCDFLSKYKVNFFCFGRADSLNDEIMGALKKAGCHTIFIGVESGSQKVLDFLNKRIKIEQNINAIKLCKKYKITSDTSFMIGITDETREDLQLTKEFIKKYKPDVSNILIFNPFPGTEVFDYCIKNNLITKPVNLKEWAFWTGDMTKIKHNTSKISDKEIMDTYNEMIMFGFYKIKMKKFLYWIKVGEIKYALRGAKRVLNKVLSPKPDNAIKKA